jgi:hypothetical protein
MDSLLIIVVLLVVIAGELAYIIVRLRGGGLPWLVKIEKGTIQGRDGQDLKLPSVQDANGIGQVLEYIGCTLKVGLLAENQRHQEAQAAGEGESSP